MNAGAGARDRTTTLAHLKGLIEAFVTERRWQRFHTPKNLAISLAIEAAELMELFQWHTGPDSIRRVRQAPVRRAAAAELADCVIYCLAFANRTGIDVAQAVGAKLARNRRRYPARRFQRRS